MAVSLRKCAEAGAARGLLFAACMMKTVALALALSTGCAGTMHTGHSKYDVDTKTVLAVGGIAIAIIALAAAVGPSASSDSTMPKPSPLPQPPPRP